MVLVGTCWQRDNSDEADSDRSGVVRVGVFSLRLTVRWPVMEAPRFPSSPRLGRFMMAPLMGWLHAVVHVRSSGPVYRRAPLPARARNASHNPA